MRITQNRITDQILQSLSRNMERLQKAQRVLSSGKRINKPSDDPVGVTKALAYRAALKQFEQYTRNIDNGLSWVNFTDSALSGIDALLSRAKEIAIAQSTATAGEQTGAAVAEVEGILNQVLQIANTKFDDRYIFAGSASSQIQPFELVDTTVKYNGNSERLKREIGPQDILDINVVIDEELLDISGSLIDLKEALQNNNQTAIGETLDDIDRGLNNVLNVRAEVGAKVNRLEMTRNRLVEAETNVTMLLSETEDADISEAITDFMAQQNAYQAALASVARMIQPSLVDFLR